jgi:KaiC/GvpD/RAD55 family RecA-like ATPase
VGVFEGYDEIEFEGDSEGVEFGDVSSMIAPSLSAKYSIRNVLEGVLEELKKPVRRLTLGWPILDRMLSSDPNSEPGVIANSFIVLGAAPKAGKSMWSQMTAEHRLEQGDSVVCVDQENGLKRFTMRLLCRKAKCAESDLNLGLRGEASEEINERVQAAVAWLRGHQDRLFIVRDRALNVNQVRNILTDVKRSLNGREIFLIVDSLQKLPFGKNTADRRTNIDIWLRELESIREEYPVTILAISELRRPKEGGKYEAEETAFKESGDIEYTADLILTLDRENELKIVMFRDGESGPVAKYEKIFPHFGLREVVLAMSNVEDDETTETQVRSARKAFDDSLVHGLKIGDWYTREMLFDVWDDLQSVAEAEERLKLCLEVGALMTSSRGSYQRVGSPESE